MKRLRKRVPEDGGGCFFGGGSDGELVAWQRPNQELRLKGNERWRLILDEEEEQKVIGLIVVVAEQL